MFHCPIRLSQKGQDNPPVRPVAPVPRLAQRSPLRPSQTFAAWRDDVIGKQETEETPTDMQGGGSGEAIPTSSIPKVDSISVITSATGAFSGFPALLPGIDLNKPGPFNDTTNGPCVNIQQIAFHLSSGPPAEVGLIRRIVRVATANSPTGIQESKKEGGDGPSDPTVIRPKDSDSIVVADAPGATSAQKNAFPITYNASFSLFAFDIVMKTVLASVKYDVSIAKSAFDDKNPKNDLTVKEKKVT